MILFGQTNKKEKEGLMTETEGDVKEKIISSIAGWYPYAIVAPYLKTWKGAVNSVTPPIDDRFKVFCHFAKANIPMDSARILYKQAEISTKEMTCSANCGLKCFPN
jgi:hypothetical protein